MSAFLKDTAAFISISAFVLTVTIWSDLLRTVA
jgi:hypothetical protein